MRHARPDTVEQLASLRERLRCLDGLTERTPGKFARGSQAFVHFHEDPAGLFADVKVGGDWQRHRVSTAAEQRAFLDAVRAALRPSA